MFTQSWEDPACDLAALRPRPGETILAITSGCDNVLGFLLADPARIVSIDINPAQTYLFELKRAAFRRLTHTELLDFLGVSSFPRRRESTFDLSSPRGVSSSPRRRGSTLYPLLRGDLTPAARSFWDANPGMLDDGLLTAGGFERYFAMLRKVLAIAVGRRRLERLFALDHEEQREFYEREWNTRRWRALLGIACSKWMLGRRLDPSWFTHSESSSFGRHFTRLAEHAIADLPARSNYFLAQILLGRYADASAVPEYLRAENFETIRERLDRITTVTADIAAALEDLPPRSIDCFALSNVFEYSPRAVFERSVAAITRAARPGARLALRNLLAPRRLADFPVFRVHPALSEQLRAADRGFIYSHFEAATYEGGNA
jgi:S-adenosylmethionine-diacylglycerol 3-amino-3-carboxypropyl transferase